MAYPACRPLSAPSVDSSRCIDDASQNMPRVPLCGTSTLGKAASEANHGPTPPCSYAPACPNTARGNAARMFPFVPSLLFQGSSSSTTTFSPNPVERNRGQPVTASLEPASAGRERLGTCRKRRRGMEPGGSPNPRVYEYVPRWVYRTVGRYMAVSGQRNQPPRFPFS